jgi:hypothetical protein
MLRHVVLVKFRPEVGEVQIDEVQSKFEELASSLPQVAELHCGRNLGFIQGSSDFAIILEFASESDFHSYASDPAHQMITSLLAASRPAARSSTLPADRSGIWYGWYRALLGGESTVSHDGVRMGTRPPHLSARRVEA